MISVSELAKVIGQSRVVLFLGAGASVESGAPTGADLAIHLCKELAGGEPISSDLIETASILENRVGREILIATVRKRLEGLEPTGGMLVLPKLHWESIYTTNFDRLVEAAYRKSKVAVTPVRSNFDYGKAESSEGVPLFKLHGCLSQDIVDGHKGRMVLTERDYQEYADFRENIFQRLDLDLGSKHVLIVGHSLRDQHIRESLRQAAAIKHEKGGNGRLYALIFEQDEDRAALVEQQGITVCFGSLETMLHEVEERRPASETQQELDLGPGGILPPRVEIATIDVGHARRLDATPDRLFHGSPASYADIEENLTFARTGEDALVQRLMGFEEKFCLITGVAGVGKTTLARQLLIKFHDAGIHAWEHRPDFPFKSGEWMSINQRLQESNQRGVLLIDEAQSFMRQLNRLAEGLANSERPALMLVLTANHAQWTARIKSPVLFKHLAHHAMSRLSESEIDELTHLIDREPRIGELVDQSFKNLTPAERKRRLTGRCEADMFVCLKNIFASEALDTILLREYAELDEPLQDIYRRVAVLESTGARVHRQLVLRLLNVDASMLPGFLTRLEGLVEEFDIKSEDGLYGWETRHEVVAKTIASYKFAAQDELYEFFSTVLDSLNPTLWLELQMLRALCDRDHGIGRISSSDLRRNLLEKAIQVAPGERVPRHRLIAALVENGDLEGAEIAVREAESAVSLDRPILRYKVLIKLARAEKTEGILHEDRLAMMNEAQRLALEGIRRFPDNKYAYSTLATVGYSVARLTGDKEILDGAIDKMRDAADRILDPDFEGEIRNIERRRRSL